MEASLSISHGIKSKELLQGKKQIIQSLENIQGIDFKELAQNIDDEFYTTGITQTTMDFKI
ncbi:MAG: putative hydrolase of HD superfamily [Arcobacteraceae bacterium]